MNLLAIETNGRTVALTEQDDVVARLNTDRLLQDTVRHLKRNGVALWDGVTPFSARPATSDEQALWQGRAC